MIFAETDRLTLRSLRRDELPRLVQLLDVWEVVRWLAVVPFPYTRKFADEFYAEAEASYRAGEPQFYTMAQKSDDLLIGGLGLHPPRGHTYEEGEIEIGYWLGHPYWGKGLMTEAARAVLDIGFLRPGTRSIMATTALNNKASQGVLRHIGLRNKGEMLRDYNALRGEDTVLKWTLTREEYEADQNTGTAL